MSEQNQRHNAEEGWLRLRPRMRGPVRIHVSLTCDDFADRITLSNGTRLVDSQETADQNGGPGYEEGAVVPRKPWRRPTAREWDNLIAKQPPRDMTNSVAVVKLPGDYSAAKRNEIWTGTAEALEENLVLPLLSVCELRPPFHCIGPNRNPANLETVTINHQIGRYIGLHVDSWDQLEVGLLHSATNRVCVNVGQGDRYLLFLPFSINDIADLLGPGMGQGLEIPRRHTLIGRQFMRRFPDVPVVRCRIAPGEAYVAPTENIVHDGSSAGQSAHDEQFTIRGHIGLL